MDTEILLLLARLDQEANSAERAQLILDLKSRDVKTHLIVKETDLTAAQIRHYYRLARKLQPNVMQLLKDGKITFSLARAIASLPAENQELAARDALARGVSVASFRSKLKSPDNEAIRREIERYAQNCSEVSGLDIKIKPDGNNVKAGTWMIRYTNLETCDVIASKIVGKPTDY